jgi:hypothetical protein
MAARAFCFPMNFAAFHTVQPTTALRLLTIVMKQLLSSQANLAADFRQGQTVLSALALLAVAVRAVVAVAVWAGCGRVCMNNGGRSGGGPRLRPTLRHGVAMRGVHVRLVNLPSREVRDMRVPRTRTHRCDGNLLAMTASV